MNPNISKIWTNLKLRSISPQKKGYEFEKIIELILEEENLEPKASYKPRGEQNQLFARSRYPFRFSLLKSQPRGKWL